MPRSLTKESTRSPVKSGVVIASKLASQIWAFPIFTNLCQSEYACYFFLLPCGAVFAFWLLLPFYLLRFLFVLVRLLKIVLVQLLRRVDMVVAVCRLLVHLQQRSQNYIPTILCQTLVLFSSTSWQSLTVMLSVILVTNDFGKILQSPFWRTGEYTCMRDIMEQYTCDLRFSFCLPYASRATLTTCIAISSLASYMDQRF